MGRAETRPRERHGRLSSGARRPAAPWVSSLLSGVTGRLARGAERLASAPAQWARAPLAAAARFWGTAICLLAAAFALLLFAESAQAQDRVELAHESNGVSFIKVETPTGYADPGPGNGQITVHWTPATGGPAAHSWLVTWGTGGHYPHQTWPRLSADTRSYTIGNLTPGEAYNVRVQGWHHDTHSQYAGKTARAANVLAGDLVKPTLVRAVLDGATLKLLYDEALDENSVPAKSLFSVWFFGLPLADASQTPTGVSVSDRTVTLTLGKAAIDGRLVEVTYNKPATKPIQDVFGNDAAGFANLAVHNITGDTTGPALVSASVNGTALSLVFNETLEWLAGLPPASAFTVSGAGGAVQTPSRVAMEGSTVTLTLGTAAAYGESVTVSYVKRLAGDAVNLQDVARNLAPSFTGRAVRNATGPAFASAEVDGDTVTLVFDGTLDPSSVPAPGDFTVSMAGVVRAVAEGGVSIADKTVTLTLALGVAAGRGVTVSYGAGTRPLRSADRFAVPDFSAQSVTNLTVATRPVVESASVNGTALTLVFDQDLDGVSKPRLNDLHMATFQLPRPVVTGIALDGRTATLSLSPAVRSGSVVHLQFNCCVGGQQSFRDPTGERAFGFLGQVENRTPPVFSSARVNAAALAVTFDVALDATSKPAPAAFTVTVDGAARTPTGVSIDGAKVKLTLAPAVTPGQTVALRYAAPGTGAKLQDAAGHAVAGFSETVENATDTTAPRFESASVDGTALTVTFDEPLDGESAPAGSRFTVIATPQAGSARSIAGTGTATVAGATVSVALASAVAHGEGVTLAYAVPATNPIRDRADPANAAAAFSGRTVTNATLHPDAPRVTGVAVSSSAGADRTYGLGQTVRVRLDFDRAVQVSGTPRLKLALESFRTSTDQNERWAVYASGSGTAALVFDYTVAAPDRSVSGLAVRANTLELNGGTIRSVAASRDAHLAHGGLAHDRAHRVDHTVTALPAPWDARVDGTALRIGFTGDLDETSVPAANAFTVTVAGTAGASTGVAVKGRTVTLTLAATVDGSPTVTVGYAKPTTGKTLKAIEGGREVASFSGQAVTVDTTHANAPRYVTASVFAQYRNRIYISFSGNLKAGPPPASAFDVLVDGTLRSVVRTVTHEGFPGLQLHVTPPTSPGQRVTVSYDKARAGSEKLVGTNGHEVASFTDQLVHMPPVLTGAAVNGSVVTLTYDVPLDGDSVPSHSTSR